MNPSGQPDAIDARRFRNQIDPPGEDVRQVRVAAGPPGEIGVEEQRGEIEAALAEQALGIDGEPAFRAEVQHVSIMEVAMERDLFAGPGQQRARRGGTAAQPVAAFGEDGQKVAKPVIQRTKGQAAWCLLAMQAARDAAELACGCDVVSVIDKIGQRAATGGAG
ncbi:hypothetical protein AA12717_0715 [Gluconacetobacter sacchari DSM 12717]|uniref:Uncharacterized protein n=1 Tax=Gluconacetobacter sacchari DSM 12717 TaxID=1307940 RepID=A0ABQ0P4F8_9PROT|nr:hypothetical protein [Gluconacetobacter sacchari]GBQ20922.1 hypothetical protein AA12717_0715 [Gluconacetobacter sacchari DSM 12717]